MRTKFQITGAAAIIVALSAFPAGAETLNDVLALTYTANPTLEAQRASLRAQDESVAQALAGRRPSVTLSTSIGRSNSAANTTVNSTPASLSLAINQTLYRGGRIVAGIDQAEINILSARAGLLSTEQQVLSSAVSAYINVLRDQAVLQLNRSSEQVLTTELQATRNRFELGDATITDIAQSEAAVSASAASRIQSEGSLLNSLATFERIVGAAPGQLETPQALTALIPESLAQAIAIGLAENPSILSAQYTEVAARISVDTAQAARLPTVTLSARTTRSENRAVNLTPAVSTSLTLSLSMPLYQSGAEFASIRSAIESNARSLIQLEDARRSVQASVTQAWQQLAVARAGIVSRSDQVRASLVAVEGVRQEEQVGARTRLNVLNAEQQLLNARVSLVTARRDELVASYGLLAAMGRLTAAQLGLAVNLYNPAENYLAIRGSMFGINP
ncbi:MAG: TolC family outer membrane protein [Alphaproteobacteria bacterium]|jgi:outer membrane protein|nr:TolC family outer membrane protein [Alphaproteobacteria bacterium]MBT4710710.1 TolC family outer membrane protein [Alphaproteobacteria bacterium]MBT5860510.1 TolC family outer membrane protein [Alphaproteobacteria bacterium]